MYNNERRRFDRFDVDFSVEIKRSGAGVNYNARCHNISANGVDLLTEEGLIPDADLELWLDIPDGHAPLRSLARVIWSKQISEDGWRSGLEFRTVDFMGVGRIFDRVRKKSELRA